MTESKLDAITKAFNESSRWNQVKRKPINSWENVSDWPPKDSMETLMKKLKDKQDTS